METEFNPQSQAEKLKAFSQEREKEFLDDLRRIRAREQNTRHLLREGGLTDEQIAERLADLERVDPRHKPGRSAFTEDQFEILETAFSRVLGLFHTVCINMDQDLRQQQALLTVLDKHDVVTCEEVDEEDEAIFGREGTTFMRLPPAGEECSRRWRLKSDLHEVSKVMHSILECPPELSCQGWRETDQP
jgi:hypothetical protein